MTRRNPRIAVRGLILLENRLLLVNAYAGNRSDLWAAPGGGAESGVSLKENLVREMHEETGLTVRVGDPALVNEFHDPGSGFHQVDVYFHCTITGGQVDDAWRDPEGVVTRRRFFSQDDLASGRVRFKPDAMPAAAWGTGGILYDPLEAIVR